MSRVALSHHGPSGGSEAARKRVEALTAERKAWRENAKKLATDKGKMGEINPHYIFAELNKLLKPDDVVLNEGVRNAGACLLQLERPLPNTCVRSSRPTRDSAPSASSSRRSR